MGKEKYSAYRERVCCFDLLFHFWANQHGFDDYVIFANIFDSFSIFRSNHILINLHIYIYRREQNIRSIEIVRGKVRFSINLKKRSYFIIRNKLLNWSKIGNQFLLCFLLSFKPIFCWCLYQSVKSNLLLYIWDFIKYLIKLLKLIKYFS